MQDDSTDKAREALVLGLDLGTGGARVVVVSSAGELLARGEAPIAGAGATGERHEQQPAAWWQAARDAMSAALSQLSRVDRARVTALSVDGTSGTVVGLDSGGEPVTPALMYNDARASSEAVELSALSGGTSIASSFSIAKLAWLARHEAAAFAATEVVAHQADYVAGRLCGAFGHSDWSNALKTGYDVVLGGWPAWLDAVPGLRSKLPRVVAPGELLGTIDPRIAAELGVPEALVVVAGCTDGTAGFLASGAAEVGDDNTTLGTTLVFKRVARERVLDEAGALYCHALPGGLWLPGAASNVGADWIRQDFGGRDPAELDRGAAALLPSPHLAYPSRTRGERFPFRSESATGFCVPPVESELACYAAALQGTAFVERLAYEVLDEATGATPRGAVFATGGGSRSEVWTQLRADVCGRVFHRPASSESAFGSAVLAAVGAGLWPDLSTACRHMVRIESTVRPDPQRGRALEPLFQGFCEELRRRDLLPASRP